MLNLEFEFNFFLMKKVLIIEDQKYLCETIHDYLSMEGFQVIFAQDGLNGVQMAHEQVPDIIVCDIYMPLLNGYEVIGLLQDMEKTASIPFIYMSAKTEKEDIRMGMDLGADDYLTKPFELSVLLSCIKARLRKSEKILQAGQESLKEIMDNPLIGLLVLQNRVIKYINPKIVSLFGVPSRIIYQISFFKFIANEKRPELKDKMAKCLSGKLKNATLKSELINKKKEIKEVEIFCKKIVYLGADALLVSFLERPQTYTSTNISEKIFSKLRKMKFTKQQKVVIKNLALGKSNFEIASELDISAKTIANHKANILAKANLKKVSQLHKMLTDCGKLINDL